MRLAADRGAESEMLGHARALADLGVEGRWAPVWARAKIEADSGAPEAAVARLRSAVSGDRGIAVERQLDLAVLEAEILARHGWLAEASVAVEVTADLARQLSDRGAAVQAALLSAMALTAGSGSPFMMRAV